MIKAIEKIRRSRTPYIKADFHKCKACWKCVGECPRQIIEKVGFLWHKHVVFDDPENCSGCQKCLEVCPYGVYSTSK